MGALALAVMQDDDKRNIALALAVRPALDGVEPEPVTKGLYEDVPRASTFAELREIGERFGHVIRLNSVRILVDT